LRALIDMARRIPIISSIRQIKMQHFVMSGFWCVAIF
jgi:hypothetical protein